MLKSIIVLLSEYASTLYLGLITPFPLLQYKVQIELYQLLENCDSKNG